MTLIAETVFGFLILGTIVTGGMFMVRWGDAVEHLKKQNLIAAFFWPMDFSKEKFNEAGLPLRKAAVKWLGLHLVFAAGYFICWLNQ